jgi:hypothetical protein
MKYIYILLICIVFTSCDSFLDLQPLDVPTSATDIFKKRTTAEKYLYGVYSFMPNDSKFSTNGVSGEPWVPAADEADNGFNHNINQINNGSWNPGNIPYDKWAFYWKGIHEASYFMQNIGVCDELSQDQIKQFYNEAKFLRAYYYFLLMRLYGPVPLQPTEVSDDPNSDEIKRYPSRSTWAECVDFVTQELDEAAANLKKDLVSSEYGRPTPGAALAIKSRLLLYSASELFNPRNTSVFKGWVSYKTGQELVPSVYDVQKWKKAADAAKDVINLQAYSLMEKYDNSVLNPYKSLYSVFIEQWNSETIFGRIINDQAFYQRLISRSVNNNCWGGINPSQKLVDAYAMKNGKYPITGYRDASSTTDGGEFPIIDPTSGYFEVGVDETFNAGVNGYINNYEHPFDGNKRSIARMWADREPRFYMDIAYNAQDYYLGITGDGFVATGAKFRTLNHAYNGTGGLPNASHTSTGYTMRKMTSRAADPTLATAAGWVQPFVYPMIRLSEIYLNYVEALVEYDYQNADVLTYWNKIRRRAGVPNIESVYPGIQGDQAKLREMIRRERQIELALEGHRYFDTRRWAIADKTNNGKIYGMNIYSSLGSPMGKPKDASGNDTFYKRAVSEYGNRVFKKSYYLWPINQEETNRNRIIEQAPGW